MATSLPPGLDEMVDGDALVWLVQNGYLDTQDCLAVQDLGSAVIKAGDFKAMIAYEGTIAEADNQLMPYKAMTKVATDAPCTVAPINFGATGSSEADAFCTITVFWDNPVDAQSYWDVEVWKAHNPNNITANYQTLTYTLLTTVACSGPSTSQSVGGGDVIEGDSYVYYARYAYFSARSPQTDYANARAYCSGGPVVT